MDLIIGGYSQGKRQYLLQSRRLAPGDILDGASCPLPPTGPVRALDRLHLLVRRCLEAGLDPQAVLEGILGQNPGVVILCDEVGGGLVPIDPAERAWREEVGRLCCRLAQRARRVERVFCGLPTLLKGDAPCS